MNFNMYWSQSSTDQSESRCTSMWNLSLMPERAGKPITSCSSGPGRKNTRCHMCVCWGLLSWTHSSWNDSHANCSSPLYALVWRYSAVFHKDFTVLHVFNFGLFIFNSEQNFQKWPKWPEMASFHGLTAWLACSTAVSMVKYSIADIACTHTSSSHVSLLFLISRTWSQLWSGCHHNHPSAFF